MLLVAAWGVLVGCEGNPPLPDVPLVPLTIQMTDEPLPNQAQKSGPNISPLQRPAIRYAEPRLLANLPSRLTGLSGLATSLRDPNRVWFIRGSGDRPRLYAYDVARGTMAEHAVSTLYALDWESLDIVDIEGRPVLVIADTGDELNLRNGVLLSLVDEPRPGADPNTPLPLVRYIAFKFNADVRTLNCEAVAVDPNTGDVLLMTKAQGDGSAGLFHLPLFPGETGTVLARRLVDIELPRVAGMDLSPDGMRMIVVNPSGVYEYQRAFRDEPWPAAIARGPRVVAYPPRLDVSAVTFAADGRAILLGFRGGSGDSTPQVWQIDPTIRP